MNLNKEFICIGMVFVFFALLPMHCSYALLYFNLTQEVSWQNGSFYVALDLNGDGKKEIISADKSENVYAWNASGDVLPGWPIRATGYVYGIAVDDINSDGKAEVVFGDTSGYFYAYYDGTEAWSKKLCRNGQDIESEPVIADMDGDGNKEIIVQCSSFTDSDIYVLDREGNILSPWPKGYEGMVSGPISVSDIDGDGKREILATSKKIGESIIYVTRANGSVFSEDWPQRLYGETIAHSPVSGDVDGDGEKEIIVTSNGNPSIIYVFEKNGSKKTWNSPANGMASRVLLEDIDYDGAMEIIASWGGTQGGLFVWNGNGSMVWSYSINDGSSNSEERYSPLLKDIDGDGSKEVIVPARNALYIFSSGGRLLEKVVPSLESCDYCNYDITHPQADDMDDDGKDEIVFGAVQGMDKNTFVYQANYQEDDEAPTTRTDFEYNDTWVNSFQTIRVIEEDNFDDDPETKYCISSSPCIPNETIDDGEVIGVFSDGVTYVIFNSTDDSGLSEIFENVVRIDRKLPEIFLYGPENLTYNRTEVALNYVVNDEDSGVDDVFYSLDGEENQTLSGNITISTTEGTHLLEIYATDRAGNMRKERVVFACDVTAPEIENLEIWPDYFSAELTISSNENSSAMIFYGNRSDSLVSNRTDGVVGKTHIIEIPELRPGSVYYFYARVCDNVGNCYNTSVLNFTTMNCDDDGDGYNSTLCGGNDCDDKKGSVHPGSKDICGNGIDEDCSGSDLHCSSHPVGGGGGGGYAAMPGTAEDKDKSFIYHKWSEIFPDKLAEANFEKEGFSVYRIVLKVGKGVKNAALKAGAIERPESIKNPPLGKVFQYIKIDKKNINDDDIVKSVISFYVNRSWVEDNDINASSVVLMRYQEGWKPLETALTSVGKDRIYYEAITPGFSYFAVVGKENEKHPSVLKGKCGNRECEENENCDSCPEDCGACKTAQEENGENVSLDGGDINVSSGSITGKVAVDVAMYFIIVIAGLVCILAAIAYKQINV